MWPVTPINLVLESMWTEVTVSLADGRVWLSFAVALLLGAMCLIVGTWVARRVGLLSATAPGGEILGVGLGTGLLVIAASWAALFSGGGSSLTPVALVFAIAIVFGVPRSDSQSTQLPTLQSPSARETDAVRRIGRTALPGGAFVILTGLLYAITMAPSPRDGVQPVEFLDVAYYSALGADLARTGIESMHTPSGFDDLPGISTQSWYHWGELWLAASVISVTAVDPVIVRHVVVLPLLLLAAAALTGTLVRRFTPTSARGAFLFGAAASIFLAPLPVPGRFFGSWATGLIFGITMYGIGAITALLSLYLVATHASWKGGWGPAIFRGALLAALIPAHVVIAVLAFVGIAAVSLSYTVRWLLAAKRPPFIPKEWRRTIASATVVALITAAWGILTGHTIGITGVSANVTPFNEAWRESLMLTMLGAGVLLAVPSAWFMVRRRRPLMGSVFAGTTLLVLFGALAWGARLGDFTMFHVFYGAIAVFVPPVAAVAVWIVCATLRDRGHRRLAMATVIVCAIQLEIGVAAGIFRLFDFGANHDYPIPVTLLDEVAALPQDAKLAYSCRPFEEAAFWNPRLVSIYAHAGRPVVPMCFQTEVLAWLNDSEVTGRAASPLFRWAPQQSLYPTFDAEPSAAAVLAFLKHHGIDYIYVDASHPNVLVSNAYPIATHGMSQVLRIP